MPVQALGPALPTLTDHMNAVEDRDIRNTTAKQAIDVNDLKLEVERLNQLHQIASSATDQASYDRARATVGKLLGPDILADIPEQYDPAVIDQFKRELVPVKDQIEQAINKMKAENPFGNSLAGKLAAAEAKGDTASADLLRRSIGEAAQAGGIQQMVDFGGNTIDARRFPGQRSGGISGMMGGGSPAPRQPMADPGTQAQLTKMPARRMPEINDGTMFSNAPINPKQEMEAFQTNEAIRKEAGIIKAKKQAQTEVDLPKIEDTAIQMNDLLDRVINHPGMPRQVGLFSDVPVVPGSAGADFMQLYNQIGGQQFLQAFETLKGGGQITEVEGNKATQAIAAMGRSQSKAEFVKNARIFQDIINNAVDRSRKAAQGNFTPTRRLGDKIPAAGNEGVVDYRDWMK